MRHEEKFWRVAAWLIASSVVIASVAMIRRSWQAIHDHHVVHVFGSAKQRIRSDVVYWRLTLTSETNQVDEHVREAMTESLPLVLQGLERHGVLKNELKVEPIAIEERYSDRDKRFRVNQVIEVRSNDIERLAKIVA